MILYICIIYLIGTPISFEEGKPTTLELCKQDGFRIVRDYQEGNIRAKFECEAR